MRFIVRHYFRDLGNYYVTEFFKKIYKELQNKYQQHSFDIINCTEYENNGYGSIYSCMNMSIVNPESEKYILISFFDNWKYHFMQHLGWKPSNMVKFFYAGGFNYIDYFNYKLAQKNNPDIHCPNNINNIYQSFFYNTYEDNAENLYRMIYNDRKLEDTLPYLYFRGYMWDFRKDMVKDIKDSSIYIIDKNTDNNNLNYYDYLHDLSRYRMALSLPGGTEVCNRDIECFAIGTPVMRPFLDIDYPEKLISNYHYINCYQDCKYWDGIPFYLSYKDFAYSLEHYWNLIKDNFEYLHFVSKNARQWFDKNCSIDNNINYILSKINIEELK